MSEPQKFESERRVEFCETDAAGIAHFSAFLCYMEQVEHAFWRSLGSSVVQELDKETHLSWPRVHVECDYLGTARFEDVLQVTLRVVKLGAKSLTYAFDFACDGKPVAQGQVVAVCCEVRKGQPLRSLIIPDAIRNQLRAYVPE